MDELQNNTDQIRSGIIYLNSEVVQKRIRWGKVVKMGSMYSKCYRWTIKEEWDASSGRRD